MPGTRRPRRSLTTQAQIPVPGAGFLSDRENWCEGDGVGSQASGAPDQTPHMLRMLLANPAHSHRQHHNQSQSAPHTHFFEPPNGVYLKSERHIQSTVHAFHGRPVIRFPFPFIAVPVEGG